MGAAPGRSRPRSTFRSALPRNTAATLVAMAVTALRVARAPARRSSACAAPTPRPTCRRWSRTTSRRSAIGEACEALLLTPKARVIAPLVVLRRGVDDFLLLTEPGLGERVRATLLRSRFAAKCEIEREEHASSVVLGARRRASRPPTTASPAVEVLDDATRADDRRRRARAAAHPRRDSALRPRDRRSRPPGRGGARRARGRLREGLLPGPGADRAPALPRPREPDAARARDRRGRRCPAYDAELDVRGQGRRPRHERRSRRRAVAALGYVRVEVPHDAELQPRRARR